MSWHHSEKYLCYCLAITILTLRRERGGAYDPPLEDNFKFIRNGAPKVHNGAPKMHMEIFLLLKFGQANFSSTFGPVGATGGHRWPPGALWPILS